MNIIQYREVKKELEIKGVQMIAVSKTRSAQEIMSLYNEGQRAFGENRAAEMKEKSELLPDDIQWHMIGRLQTNKVKSISPFVHMIQSCDRWKLAAEIQKHAARFDRIIPILLEVKIAKEESKAGFSFEELKKGLSEDRLSAFPNLEVRGLMAMATFTSDSRQLRSEFHQLASYFKYVKSEFFNEQEEFSELSMGMSGDYQLALEEGSTMVRLGTILFGPRSY